MADQAVWQGFTVEKPNENRLETSVSRICKCGIDLRQSSITCGEFLPQRSYCDADCLAAGRYELTKPPQCNQEEQRAEPRQTQEDIDAHQCAARKFGVSVV
jgi:hypothetical protein